MPAVGGAVRPFNYKSFLNNFIYLYLIVLKQQGFSAIFNENEFEVYSQESLVKSVFMV